MHVLIMAIMQIATVLETLYIHYSNPSDAGLSTDKPSARLYLTTPCYLGHCKEQGVTFKK